MVLSVIIPVYNEQTTVYELIQRVFKVDLNLEVIVVDDCSTDGTDEVLRTLLLEMPDRAIKSIRHERNQGKGAAIRTGIQHVTGNVVVIQDADLEYDPQEYHLLLQPILDGKADVVYGSRFLGGRPHRVLYFWHMVGNKFLTLLSDIFTNLTLTDMETCYKMVRSDLMKRMTIEQNRFGFEPEITAKLARMNVRFYEVGISYDGRSYAEGKKIGWRDGVKAIWCILKYSRGRYRDVGKKTLKQLESFEAYAQWMYRKIRPHLGHRILEVGSGIGNYVPYWASNDDTEIILTDYREDYVKLLRTKFGTKPNIQIYQYDATQAPGPELKQHPPDTIVCLNVLEHIEQDRLALSRCYELLTPGGQFIVLVPAFRRLYCKIDENLEHYRRYSRQELQKKLVDAGFTLQTSFYFNPIGAVGWFVAGKVLRARHIKANHVAIQKLLMPVTYLVDQLNLPFGLSVVCVGRKPLNSETSFPGPVSNTTGALISNSVDSQRTQ